MLLVTSLTAAAHADAPDAAAATPTAHEARVGCRSASSLAGPALRVMTLNLAHGRGIGPNQVFLGRDDFEDNLAAVSDVLATHDVDVVGLQEVDGPSRWSGGFDHAETLARRGAYPWHFRADHATSWLYRYGTAVLSRLPVHGRRSHRFEATPPTPRKGLVAAEVRLAHGADLIVNVLSVHFDFLSHRARARQLAETIAFLDQRDRPTILLGDFNSTWEGADSVVRQFVERTGLKAYEPQSDQLATHGSERLDWILISDDLRFETYEVLPVVVSDHQPVVADIRVAGGSAPPGACDSGGAGEIVADSR